MRTLLGLKSGTVPTVTRTEQAALTPAQERLWLLEQLEPGRAMNNLTLAIEVKGTLDMAALKRSLNYILQRQRSLQTGFKTVNGRPGAQTTPIQPIDLVVEDWSQLPAPERETQAVAMIENEAQAPFDLPAAPLFRAKLARLAPDEHVLCITMHHLVSDGASLQIFYNELTASYQAFASGGTAPSLERPTIPATPAQKNGDLEPHLAFWKQQLGGKLPVLDLPGDRSRPAVQSFRGGMKYFAIPEALRGELKQLCQAEKVTLFTVLLGAFQTLLHRYSGQEDIVVGTCAPRQAETERQIGLFTNTVALRLDLSGDPAFRTLLGKARETVAQAYAHQDAPLEKIAEAIGAEWDLSRAPIFQAMLSYQERPLQAVELAGLTFDAVRVFNGTSRYDVSITLEEQTDGLQGTIEYNTDIFDEATIVRMVGHFQALLESIAADPDRPLSRLPLLPEAERAQLLTEWNNTATAYPQDKCVHDLFEEQVQRTPESVAVVFEDQSLTYSQLNERANALAAHLQSRGVGPETRVGVCMVRSLEMIVALLAIHKAGGAYVPLDPTYPRERLAFIVDDAQAPVLLTQSFLKTVLPASRASVIHVDELQLAPQATSPRRAATPDHIAYVIYTSGSTGNPKGVMVLHRNVVNFFTGMDQSIGSTPGVWLAVTSISFDISVLEIFWTLARGFKLVVQGDDSSAKLKDVRREEKTGYSLPEQIVRHQVTHFQCTPSLAGMLLEEPKTAAALKSVKKLFFGGEPMPPALVERLAGYGEVFNMYGPTETTIWSTVHPVTRSGGKITIGHPIANTEIYILDKNIEPCPIGVSGELYIGGAGVVRGYLNRPELSAERFIRNPFKPGAGQRIYRTGDLARFRADGEIDFLGRIDHQVKLRGFRIELGEIEAALRQHPSVKECVVSVWEASPTDKRLVGYIVPQPGPKPQPIDLRRFAKQKLPEYMVPALFVNLEAMPLTPNGKIDRKALPKPELPRSAEETAAPQTEAEQAVAGIFRELLKLDRVSVNDNFFSRGGRPVMAVQLQSRLKQLLRVSLPLVSIFQNPTVGSLARLAQSAASTSATNGNGEVKQSATAATDGLSRLPEPTLETNGARQVSASAPALRPPLPSVDGRITQLSTREILPSLPLTEGQREIWFASQLSDAASCGYNISALLHMRGALDEEALSKAIQAILERHEAFRITFSPNGDAQYLHPQLPVLLRTHELSGGTPEERARELEVICEEEVRTPFDLAKGPMIRLRLVKQAPGEHVLVATVHHVICDGASCAVFLDELGKLYSSRTAGTTVDLKPAPQFTAFVREQNRIQNSPERAATEKFWLDQFATPAPMLTLPTDHPRPAVRTTRGGHAAMPLSSALGDGLKKLNMRNRCTMFTTVLAAYYVFLHRLSGQPEIVVGVPMTGRTGEEVENLIGHCVNFLPMRMTLDGNPTFSQHLARVRNMLLGAMEHQAYTFGSLVQKLNLPRDQARMPLVSVMFNVDWLQEDCGMAGLQIELATNPKSCSTFDFSLNLADAHGKLELQCLYARDLFEPETIDRWFRHFATLLESIVANPDTPIGKLAMLSEPERRQIVVDWNQAQLEVPQDLLLHQLFERQAATVPNQVALRHEHAAWTYQDINQRANQIAHHLRAQGVTAGALVGICLERTPELVAVLLAIMKAGAAYVPLDATYPAERLIGMLEGTGTSFVVSSKSVLAQLPALPVRTICLEEQTDALSRASVENIPPAIAPTQLAYVMFTSGSTGGPKGVAIEHRNAVAFMHWAKQQYTPEELGGVLASTSICFDLSVFEFFAPLSWGGKVVLADDPMQLANLPAKSEVRLVNTVPSAVPELLKTDALSLAVRTVNLAGEALSRELVDQLYNVPSLEKVYDLYGPTENTTYSTAALRKANRHATIGRPLPNTEVYILDQYSQPCPIGVHGELYVGGMQLARGYVRAPELTAQKFVPHPFSAKPGARLYRTGDLARFHPDGEVQFLGRIDYQIKIRGYRIEPGEIESELRKHPAVLECVAALREDVPGQKMIVAYVVCRAGQGSSSNELRQFLGDKLPAYALPAAFVFLEALPMTPNGKLDRRALPSPEQASADLEPAPASTPMSEPEQRLATIWREVIGLSELSRDDNFFDLGGHSILITQIIGRVRKEFGVELTLRHMFEASTVAEMSRVIEQKKSSPRNSGVAQPA